jgi:hypothetical protein
MKSCLSIIRGLPRAFPFLLPVILAIAPTAFAGELQCLKLKQTAPSTGPVTVYLTKTALRVNRGDVVTIARAPDWQVFWYNSKKKISMTEPYKKALKGFSLVETTSTAILEVSRPWKKGGVDDIAGLPATKLSNEPNAKTTSNGIRNLRYWQYLDNDLPKQEGEWLATCYGVPNLGGIPVRCKFFGKTSALIPMSRSTDGTFEDQFWLDTKDAHKEVVPESLFVVPKGYRETHNVTDLYLAQPLSKDSPMIKELLEDPESLFRSQ